MNNPKKILIFSLVYYPDLVGGAEVSIKEITDRVSPSEISFDMVTLRFDRRLPKFEKIGNVNIHRIGFTKISPTAVDLVRFPMFLNKAFYPVLALFYAFKLHRKNRYDAIWSMMSYMGFPAVFLKLFFRKLPYILTLEEGDDLLKVSGRKWMIFVRYFWKRVFSKPLVIQAISNYLADWAREMGAKGQVLVVPNGVDINKFGRMAEIEQSVANEKYGIKPGDEVVVTTSRLVPKNGIGDLIKSMIFLPEEVKLLIAGDGPLKNELEKLSRDLKLGERVRFVGFLGNDTLPEFLKVARVFVRPSRSEGMGISFLEAMAAGVPVVATAVGGIVDFLKDKETGLVCGVGDPNDIAHKISVLLRDKEVRDYVVKNAEKMVRERYSWDLIVGEMREKVFSIAWQN